MDLAAELRQQLGRASAVAAAANERIKNALAEGDTASARRLIGDLEQADRENAQLPKWQAEVMRLEAVQAAASTSLQSNQSDEQRAAPRMYRESPPAANGAINVTAPNAGSEMARQFLADAESALAQKRFDAARTFAESARRLDPSNPRVRLLMRAIQERERQILREETTIN